MPSKEKERGQAGKGPTRASQHKATLRRRALGPSGGATNKAPLNRANRKRLLSQSGHLTSSASSSGSSQSAGQAKAVAPRAGKGQELLDQEQVDRGHALAPVSLAQVEGARQERTLAANLAYLAQWKPRSAKAAALARQLGPRLLTSRARR